MADDVELAALEQQVVGIDLPALLSVAPHRVVVEDDRLAAEDRGLDLRQPLGELAPARASGHGERDAPVLGSRQRRGLAPRQLLERQPQRLRVRELTVEQRQCGAKSAELRVAEL